MSDHRCDCELRNRNRQWDGFADILFASEMDVIRQHLSEQCRELLEWS